MISAQAVRAYQRGEPVPAEEMPSAVAPQPRHYLSLVVDNPDAARSPQAAELVNRAALCLRENQIPRAFDFAQEAVRLAPDNAEAWVAFGAASAGQPDWAAVIAASRKAVALKPAKPETLALAHLLRGNAHAAREEFSDAIKAYKQALSVSPENADAFLNLGLAQGRSGHLQDSLETYERGLAVVPRDLEMQIGRGIMLASLDRREEANIAFRTGADMADAGTAEARKPESTPIVYDLAGRHEDGINAYRQLADREPTNAEVNFLCAVALLENKQPDTAISYFEKAIALDPDNADAHAFYGESLYALRQWGAALEAYDRAIALDPAYAAVYVRRAYAFAQLGRADDVIVSLDKALHGITKDSVRPSRALTDDVQAAAYRYLNDILKHRTRQTEDFKVLGTILGVLDRVIGACPIPEVRQTAASEKKYVGLKMLALLILQLVFHNMLDPRQRTAFILHVLKLIEVPDSEILPSLEAVMREVAARRKPAKKRRRPSWAKRPKRERELSPPEFIKRHYRDLIDAGTLSLADLADFDPPLYMAFRGWKAYRKSKKQPIDIGFDLPTKREMTDRLIDRAVASGIRPKEASRIATGLNWRRRKGPAPK